MNSIEIIGFMAAILTSSGFFPQALKSFKTKSVEDLSWGMLIIFATGVSLWLIYGLMNHDRPIIVANAITLFFLLVLIVLKVKYN